MKKKLFLIIILLYNSMLFCTAQNRGFDLVKKNGHFYTSSNLNGVPVEIMIESGTPALILSINFYYENKEKLSLDLKEDSLKMRFLNRLYDVKFSGNGKLKFGNILYEGPIFILDGKIDASLPIQYLKNPKDGSSIVEIDLSEKKLTVIGKEAFDTANYKNSLPIKLKELGNMPVVNTELAMTIEGKKVSAKGDFIIDMGNASLLFLMKQNETICTMIAENDIKLKEARDTKGNLVAEGIYAENLTICGRSYSGVSVGITDKLKSIKEAGFLGVKFMTIPIVIDFNEKMMYIK